MYLKSIILLLFTRLEVDTNIFPVGHMVVFVFPYSPFNILILKHYRRLFCNFVILKYHKDGRCAGREGETQVHLEVISIMLVKELGNLEVCQVWEEAPC